MNMKRNIYNNTCNTFDYRSRVSPVNKYIITAPYNWHLLASITPICTLFDFIKPQICPQMYILASVILLFFFTMH